MKLRIIITSIVTAIITAYVAVVLLEHNMYYQASHSLFTFDWQMLANALTSIGGLGEYLAAFVVQFFAVKWLGVLVFTMLSTVSYLLLERVLKYWGDDYCNLSLVFPMVGVALFASAQFSFASWMCLLLVLTVVWLWQNLHTIQQIVFGIIAASVLYPLVGEWHWLFALSTLLAIILRKDVSKWNIISTVIAALMPLVWAFPYFRIVHYEVENLAILFLIYFLVAVLAARFVPSKGKIIFTLIYSLIIVTSSGYLFVSQYDVREKLIVKIDRALCQRNWDEVIEVASKYPGRNILVTYAVNVALLNRGELVESIMDFPQTFAEQGLFIGRQGGNRENEFIDHVYASLGMYNEAHHQCWEAMTSQGYNVSNLQRLILYNRLRGNEEIARKLNRKLSRTLFYGDFYDKINPDEYVSRCVGNQMIRFNNPSSITSDLAYLSSIDTTNRRVGETFLVSLLLSNRLILLADNIQLVKRLYPSGLPSIFEQALLILKMKLSKEEFERLGINISPATEQLLDEYGTVHKASQGNTEQMKEFRNTYFYYLNFISPNGAKVITK